MADMFHEITINATTVEVFDAISLQEGLKGWWTRDSTAEPKEGTLAIFRFNGGSYVLKMRVVQLLHPMRLLWKCEGDDPEWRGTELTWEVTPNPDGQTTLRLTHANWSNVQGQFPTCNTTWGHLMYLLQSYCEGRPTDPLFEG